MWEKTDNKAQEKKTFAGVERGKTERIANTEQDDGLYNGRGEEEGELGSFFGVIMDLEPSAYEKSQIGMQIHLKNG